MAVYYVDPFKNTDGTGTFADPKGMWFSTPFTLAAGDELRIIGRTLASMLTATEYTVTIRDSAVASNGGALSALSGGSHTDFLQHDIVYFPDYDVFMRLSAGTFSGGNYLSGTYNAIPIPVAGKLTGVRMRLVDRAILPSFTTPLAYITSAASNNGYSVSDNWTADGVRNVDGTAKTLLTCGATGNFVLQGYVTSSVITEALKVNLANNIDLSNSFLIAGKAGGSPFNIRIDWYNTNLTIRQVYSTSTANSQLIGSSGAAQYGYGNNITIKNINFYTTLINQLATNSSYKFENVVGYANQTVDGFSKYCNNTVIEFDNINYFIESSATVLYFQGSQGLLVKLNNYLKYYTDVSPTYLRIGNGNVDVQFGASFSITDKHSSTPASITSAIYAIYDNTQFAQQNETYYRKPNLPAGFTVTNEFGLAIPAGSTVYPLGNGKRVATRKMVLKGFSSTLAGNLLTQGNYYTNTAIVSADGGFNPLELLGIQNCAQVNFTSVGSINLFQATQDTTTFKTVSPSLKFLLTTYQAGAWIGNATGKKARAYKNTAIPCVSGTPITVSGWVRTSDTSYVSGDFSVSLVDANGDDVATEFNPTSAFINAWEQFSFTVTPTYTGELFLAFGMTGYRGGQTYWVSDMGVA